MSIDNIIFEDLDTFEQTARKTLLIHAGTNELKSQMKRLGVEYTKVMKGVLVTYVLRHNDFGKIIVKL